MANQATEQTSKLVMIGKPSDYPSYVNDGSIHWVDPDKFESKDEICAEYAVFYARYTWGDKATSYHRNFGYELAEMQYNKYLEKKQFQ